MNHFNIPNFENKIFTANALINKLSEIRTTPIVFTNGCFDILHRGHVTYLAQAKSLGKTLIVALNTDTSIRRLNKGIDRPINTLSDRMSVIASLESVDFVTFFDEDTPLNLIHLLNPDVLVKGGDWKVDEIIGSEYVIANGGQVISIPFMYHTSTSKLIKKIRHE